MTRSIESNENDMKWSRMWNANVVYRTEVYRISICFIVHESDDNDDDEKTLKRREKKRKRLDLYDLLIKIHIFLCTIVWFLCMQAK